MDWRKELMVNQEVNDTLYDIEQWAAAYKILVKWRNQECGGNNNLDCNKCGFEAQCTEASNLISRR